MRQTKKEILNGIEDQIINSKKIGNNTYQINYKNGNKSIRLHLTDVITFYPNGNISFNSGGWFTPTTKNRINDFNNNGYNITQKKHIWYISRYNNIDQFVFYDGITFNKNGILKGKNLKPNIKKNDALKSKIKKFVFKLDSLDKLPFPSNGDCFYCQFKDKENKPVGDIFKDQDHLKQHIKENYIHGSLLVNSLLDAGYRTEQIGFFYSLANSDNINMRSRDSFKRSLYKYLVKRLILEG